MCSLSKDAEIPIGSFLALRRLAALIQQSDLVTKSCRNFLPLAYFLVEKEIFGFYRKGYLDGFGMLV